MPETNSSSEPSYQSTASNSYDHYQELGEAAWSWVLDQIREDDGPWLPETVTVPEDSAPDSPSPAKDRGSLYAGIAGLAPVLAEIARHREPTGRERSLAAGNVNRLSEAARRTSTGGGWPTLATVSSRETRSWTAYRQVAR